MSNAHDHDLVHSFFNGVFSDKEVVESFTSMIFRIASDLNESPTAILKEIKGKDDIELSYTLAVYMNQIRSPSALLGVEVPPPVNFYAARNVLP